MPVNVTVDVMQVCLNGHPITDRLRTFPEQGLPRCGRCGAPTIDKCLTCGREIPGALSVPGLEPIGVLRPPLYCPTCGAAFPWAEQPRNPGASATGSPPLAKLTNLLRRLPRVIREFRSRQQDRPAFRVQDERDLEDLVRALLPIHFDDIRPECRTPRYTTCTRTDFLLAPERIAVTVKLARSAPGVSWLIEQFEEDAGSYRQQGRCDTLAGFIYDPEGLIREPQALETACSRLTRPDVLCVVGAG